MNRLQRAKLQHPGGPILGAAAYSYNPIFLEMCAKAGYTAAWIEMEHGFMTFAQAADLCRIASGLGMITMLRIADAGRENILKGAECGPDIIDLPMANTREDAEALVRYASFRPKGERGFFSVSRSLDYGVYNRVAEAQQLLNNELSLMVQIETVEALENLEEICSVPGIDLFIGPADLSASLDVPGQTGHSLVYDAARRIIECARRNGRMVATGAAPSDFEFYAANEVDLLFCTNDIAAMRAGALSALGEARAAVQHATELQQA